MFQPDAEAAPTDVRRTEQDQRLRDLVRRLVGSSQPFWAERLADVTPDDVGGVDDLDALPFTAKPDLRTTYPFGMLAVDRDATVRAHASSGTSGKPTIVAYTARDVEIFAEVVARSIGCAGGRRSDVLHVAYGYGLFTGGLGLHYGGERLGATVIPASGGNTDLQLTLLSDLGADGLACTPSFAMLLAERAEAEDLDDLRVRYLVCGAEPWSGGFRDRLEDAWSGLTDRRVVARDIYGLSEVIGPGVAMECVEAPGALHVFDDHFLPEIIDPDSGAVLPDGERGELVLTTLTKEAQPVLRYRTGDVTRLTRGTCACGRTHPRIDRLSGRTDDMLVVRGVNVFPREIEATLLEHQQLNGNWALVLDHRGTLLRLVIHAEVHSLDVDPQLAAVISQRLSSRLRVSSRVQVHPAGTLPRTAVGKVQRVHHRRDDAHPLGLPD